MPIALVPRPATCIERGQTACHLDVDTLIIAETGTRPEAELLAELLAPIFGRPLQVVDDTVSNASAPVIRLQRDPAPGAEEAYQLDTDANGALLRAGTPSGLGWAVQSFVQLLPPQAVHGADLPAVSIQDQPRFPWRGAMLDPSRHFRPVEDVLRFIDLMARHRLNRLHLHLTDDQGWRLEIRRYPRLTSVGAWRSETLVGHLRAGPHTYDGKPHGGFYTQEDCRRIVAHAARRHITVVPEIDLPGHMQAAIAAYPWLGNDGQPCPVFTRWGVNPHILNAEERTIRFLEDVLTEVMEIFPSPWIHVGGDEAVKDEWKTSPRIQERIRELGCGDEHGLQSYLIGRMDALLTARGRRLLGWDEILEGGLSPNATVLSWRGIQGGIEAARLGHDVIMVPNKDTYFDYYQHEDHSIQPLAIGGLTTLEKAYAFEPIPAELTAEQARHVLGSQGQLWSEYIPTREHLDCMAFPRLCALAEVLWSPKDQRDWVDFQRRLPTHLTRLDALGVAYFRAPARAAVAQ